MPRFWGNFFKSRAQREKEAEQLRNEAKAQKINDLKSAAMKANGVIQRLGVEISVLERTNHRKQAKALEFMKNGQKCQAELELKAIRLNRILADKLTKKFDVTQILKMRLEFMALDLQTTEALHDMSKIVNVDENAEQARIEKIIEAINKGEEIDEIWNDLYKRQFETVANSDSESVPSLDELMKELEEQAADELKEAGRRFRDDCVAERDVAQRVAEGTEKLDGISAERRRFDVA